MTHVAGYSIPAVCPNPVFVVGSPRSGTSILAWALGHHSAFWTSRENEVLFRMYGSGQVEAAFQGAAGSGTWLAEQQVTRAEFLACIGLGVNSLFSSRSGGVRWIDQTPVNTLMMDVLAELFPGALFLHIVRDGRRVVHSMNHFADTLGRGLQSLPKWAASFSMAARTWREFVETAVSFCERHPERCCTVVNEQLGAHPEDQFAAILRFLTAPYEVGPANFLRSSRVNSSFSPLVWGTGTADAPSLPAIGTRPWEEWTRDQRQTFAVEAGPLLVKLGFATDDQLDHCRG